MITIPPLAQSAIVAAVSASNAIGLTTPATDAVKADRLAYCLTCTVRVSEQCGACGCVLAAKAALAFSTCPKGKWPQ